MAAIITAAAILLTLISLKVSVSAIAVFMQKRNLSGWSEMVALIIWSQGYEKHRKKYAVFE
jgi:uncharacterized membrane protein